MGKQHGSLARAGKVKKQTPKVDKLEKKKVPKGRALKRIRYNRRFVNILPAMRKKTPNWHAGRKDLLEAGLAQGAGKR